ncbi:MAG: hypothetical protein UT61_C0016G0010 [Candidatus Woesebacteria bacterium GW2011_GWA1_39_8]|uniref:Uncharacterized protein n=1 Tax=Candidatus Woesebacteria bacterium GW2011_GWA1_39_8 TaxID=1618552 RepID=A0A0G0PP98_9BACT|nr:MAG: hypothetical protein UT61_C0016G0010 [Candidatus Woesebacteria bacterium GW2011_GWA1_39_8]
MNKILTKKEAVDFLGLDGTLFENYFRNACEFSCMERTKGDRFYFDKEALQKWLDDYRWRTIELNLADYQLCLDFALAQHFRGYVLSDWGTARQREFGQKMTNWIKGQLAEVAVKKFFKKEFDIDIELDFAIHDQIVPQDIIGVVEKGKKRPPKIGVGIKSSKPKSVYLVLGENEITLNERRSDVYIYCRPDIPDDHILRLTRNEIIRAVKDEPHFPTYKEKIPYFNAIPCEIAGWCEPSELEKVSSIEGQDFDGDRYVKKSGLLHRTRKDWEKLIARL